MSRKLDEMVRFMKSSQSSVPAVVLVPAVVGVETCIHVVSLFLKGKRQNE